MSAALHDDYARRLGDANHTYAGRCLETECQCAEPKRGKIEAHKAVARATRKRPLAVAITTSQREA